jgi:glycosyltransferase involved in cell wall biosynthesis
VIFTGFLNGEDKDRALASCSVLAMPSEFENLGNVILEGLVRRIPCIATLGAPWKELNTEHCGWQVPYTQKDITAAVRMALHTPDVELKAMGENGRRLMEKRYSVEAVAKDMKAVYEWIEGGSKPSCVHEIKF